MGPGSEKIPYLHMKMFFWACRARRFRWEALECPHFQTLQNSGKRSQARAGYYYNNGLSRGYIGRMEKTMETTIMPLYLRKYRDAPMFFFFMSRDKNAGLYGVYRTHSIYRRVKTMGNDKSESNDDAVVYLFCGRMMRVETMDDVINWIEGWPLGFGRRSYEP